MSKFVERLRSLSKSAATPIGFHSSAIDSKGSVMLLIAGLSGAQVKEARTAAEVNADAGLVLEKAPGADAAKQMVKAAGDVPLGVFVKDMDGETASELARSGCDFLVFGIEGAAAVLNNEKTGKFLLIEPSMELSLVRAINSLDIDGVFVSSGTGSSFIAVEHLLACRRHVELLEKPVLMTLPSVVTKAELTTLWRLGVDGVVALSGQSLEGLKELKMMVADLPRGPRGRRARVSVMLPHQGGAMAADEDEEEEEI
jgi:hypothetical protein